MTNAGDLAGMRQIATDPHTTANELAILLPAPRDPTRCPSDLARAILAHPNATAGVTGRLAAHPDPAVRAQVASHPRTTPAVLAVLTYDTDPDVAAAAAR